MCIDVRELERVRVRVCARARVCCPQMALMTLERVTCEEVTHPGEPENEPESFVDADSSGKK